MSFPFFVSSVSGIGGDAVHPKPCYRIEPMNFLSRSDFGAVKIASGLPSSSTTP
jgi:hypothetical protein